MAFPCTTNGGGVKERTIREPLELLHMDLFGPVSERDETYDMLHDLIVGLENRLRHKVKTIRCDNGTEFKNQLMNEFCTKKGIKREYSIARTPQQNGVAERKNRTLIEAARTMLADSLYLFEFWAECINTACLYQLGKFDGKSEEGYLLGYSTSSKGFRVYNRVTRKVQECLHVDFLENQENQKREISKDLLFEEEKRRNIYCKGKKDISNILFPLILLTTPPQSARTNHKISKHPCCLFPISREPKKVSQLSDESLRLRAMKEELYFQFKLQDVWVLCDLPEGKRVIGTKWVFRNKRDERGDPALLALPSFMRAFTVVTRWMSKVHFIWHITEEVDNAGIPMIEDNSGDDSILEGRLSIPMAIASKQTIWLYLLLEANSCSGKLLFVQLFLNKQLEGVDRPQDFMPSVTLPSKIFTFMRKHSPKFSCRITPLTPSMLENPSQSAAQASISQGTADVHGTDNSQGTASLQGTAASLGTARLQGRRYYCLKKHSVQEEDAADAFVEEYCYKDSAVAPDIE
ncbi:retrovirus-related pol polyprotein from transposon TNT 1-94 [Tanacetum coccineum]